MELDMEVKADALDGAFDAVLAAEAVDDLKASVAALKAQVDAQTVAASRLPLDGAKAADPARDAFVERYLRRGIDAGVEMKSLSGASGGARLARRDRHGTSVRLAQFGQSGRLDGTDIDRRRGEQRWLARRRLLVCSRGRCRAGGAWYGATGGGIGAVGGTVGVGRRISDRWRQHGACDAGQSVDGIGIGR